MPNSSRSTSDRPVIERLWSGWRSAYVAGEATDARTAFDSGDHAASVFTQLLQSGLTDEETHIVHRGAHCFAIMNAFPYTNGHLLVLPYREVADLARPRCRRNRRVVGHGDHGGRSRPPGVLSRRGERGRQPRAGVGRVGARPTCTSTWCRVGRATRTSWRRSPTRRRFPRASTCPPAKSAPRGPSCSRPRRLADR